MRTKYLKSNYCGGIFAGRAKSCCVNELDTRRIYDASQMCHPVTEIWGKYEHNSRARGKENDKRKQLFWYSEKVELLQIMNDSV